MREDTCEAMKIISSLVKGIEQWGGEEDGIYDRIYEAYTKAKSLLEKLGNQEASACFLAQNRGNEDA